MRSERAQGAFQVTQDSPNRFPKRLCSVPACLAKLDSDDSLHIDIAGRAKSVGLERSKMFMKGP